MSDYLNIKKFIIENSTTINIKKISKMIKCLDSNKNEEFLTIFDEMLPRMRENYELKESLKHQTKDILRKKFLY